MKKKMASDGVGPGFPLSSAMAAVGGVGVVDGSEGESELQADEVSDSRTVEEAYLKWNGW